MSKEGDELQVRKIVLEVAYLVRRFDIRVGEEVVVMSSRLQLLDIGIHTTVRVGVVTERSWRVRGISRRPVNSVNQFFLHSRRRRTSCS